MNKKLLTVLQYTFFLGLGIFLVWWSIKDLTADDKSRIREALKDARYLLIIPVFAILLLSHFLRAIRWRLLIVPMGYFPRKVNMFIAVMVGYLANLAFPRLGEVLRCTVLARYEKIPADKLVGTIILERMIDALTLLLVFALTLAVQPDIYDQLTNTFFKSSDPAVEDDKLPGYIIGLIAIGIIGTIILLWMLIRKKTPRDVGLLVKRIWFSVWEGVGSIRHLQKRWSFLLLTFLIWFLYFIAGYIGFYALKETEMYGAREALSILSAGSVGMIVTPGGIGAYALLIEKTMQIYGLQKGIALAFGWILWLVQTSVVLIVGLICFGLIPYFNKQKNEEA